jgi:hypothetical protein
MTIDIFQYSNMYTLRRSIQWLADEAHVREECGPYVTKPGHTIPDWPKLLRLYSRLKPGKTVFEWMESHDVHRLGIDIRRFTSFGVIKVMQSLYLSVAVFNCLRVSCEEYTVGPCFSRPIPPPQQPPDN